MKKTDRHIIVHVAFANVVEYAKVMLQKDFPKISRIDATFVIAQNTVIDERSIFIKIPKKTDARLILKQQAKLHNLYI